MKSLLRVVVLATALILLLVPAFDCASAMERAYALALKCSGEGNSQRERLGRTHCRSYITGMVDAYMLITGVAPQARFICLPEEGVAGDQAVKIFVKWVRSHPEGQDMPAKSAVLVSLGNAFPCKRE
jgi:hypothetical protein